MELTWLGIPESELFKAVEFRNGKVNLSRAAIESCVSGLLTLSPQLRPSFQAYWSERPFDKALTVEGWSIERLIAERGLTIIGAFLTLDWLIQDPSEATIALSEANYTVAPITASAALKAEMASGDLG